VAEQSDSMSVSKTAQLPRQWAAAALAALMNRVAVTFLPWAFTGDQTVLSLFLMMRRNSKTARIRRCVQRRRNPS
jgi:hypothetical protein